MERIGWMAHGTMLALWRGVATSRLALMRIFPEVQLRRAIERRQIAVHYQPVMDLRTSHCVGAEALVRWQRRDGRMVLPDAFIVLAEESGLVTKLTDMVIETVVREMRDVMAADRAMHIAINLCPADLESGRVLPVLAQAVKSSGIRATQLWLEATERGFVNVGPASATLRRARAMGHAVAMDDFGTGYSSLQHLRSLPMDALKIDKSFVAAIGEGRAAAAVIDHIIEMAACLGLRTIAEGVETVEQVRYLTARGVDLAQGWFYSQALDRGNFLKFYRRTRE